MKTKRKLRLKGNRGKKRVIRRNKTLQRSLSRKKKRGGRPKKYRSKKKKIQVGGPTTGLTMNPKQAELERKQEAEIAKTFSAEELQRDVQATKMRQELGMPYPFKGQSRGRIGLSELVERELAKMLKTYPNTVSSLKALEEKVRGLEGRVEGLLMTADDV